jgi:hypothetical protein
LDVLATQELAFWAQYIDMSGSIFCDKPLHFDVTTAFDGRVDYATRPHFLEHQSLQVGHDPVAPIRGL